MNIVDRLPISYRQFDHWCTQGWIRPTGGHNPGSGWPRQLTHTEEQVLRHMAALVTGGVSPARAAAIARELVEHGTASIGGFTITAQQED